MTLEHTQLHTGSHDLPVSGALADFMTGGWATPPPPDGTRVSGFAHFAGRRARLAARFPGERLLVPAGELRVRSHDCDHRFRPHSAYAWLTGLTGEDQPGHVLVLEPDGEAVLHLRPRPRGTPAARSTGTASTASSGWAAAPIWPRPNASPACAVRIWTTWPVTAPPGTRPTTPNSPPC